jgi:hypothetical protein
MERADGADLDITPTRVSGEVKNIETGGRRLLLVTKAGNLVIVNIDENTVYLHVPPGEKTLDKAITISLSDVTVGDRIVARGRVAEDRKSVSARQVIVMTKSDLEQRDQATRADWRKRGITGRITGLNPETKDIIVGFRERAGSTTIRTNEKAIFLRFPPDSVKFSDARPSSFSELKVGDQLRARGEKSVDGTTLVAEEVVSGLFRMAGGTIQTLNSETGEVKIITVDTGQPLTILVVRDSIVRRVPADIVKMIEARTSQAEGPKATPSGNPRSSNSPSSSGSGDIQEIIERLPPIAVKDLKIGETIVVSSTVGRNPSLITAITVAAGLDNLVLRSQKPKSSKTRIATSTDLGLPGGILEGGIGVP